MSLTDRINEDIKKAMLAKDQTALRGLRAVKSAILLIMTEPGAGNELSEEKGIALLQKLVKTRKDSLTIYEQQKREDLAVKEREEIEVIEKYLPKQLSPEEVKAEVVKIIAETGASSMKDMGKIMGLANARLAGKADSKSISDVVKAALAQ